MRQDESAQHGSKYNKWTKVFADGKMHERLRLNKKTDSPEATNPD